MIPASEPLSSKRARLASFEHAYAVAVSRRRASRRAQYIVQTDEPLQPYRTTDQAPGPSGRLLAIIL